MFFFSFKAKTSPTTDKSRFLAHSLFILPLFTRTILSNAFSFILMPERFHSFFFWYRSYQSFHWTYQLQIPLVWYSAVCCKKLWNAVDGRCFANCLPCTEFRWTWQQHRLFRLMCIFAKSIHNHCVSVSPSRCSAFCKCVTMYTFLLPF